MNTNIYTGLNDEEVKRSAEKYGRNVYERVKPKGIIRRLLDNFKDPIIRILLLAMGVNLLFTLKNINWAENAGIIIAVMISVFVSALSERGSEKAFIRLREREEKRNVRVLRNSTVILVPTEELVVGDVIFLSSGTKIPADAVLKDGHVLVDQSAINGESEPSEKSPQNTETNNERSKIYAGTVITEGECTAIVTSVGSMSLYGQIAREIQTEKAESPLKNRLSKLAKSITRIGYAAAAVVAAAYLFNVFVIDSAFISSEILIRLSNPRFVALSLIKAVTIAMTVIVVAVPEGLPMMITVVLSRNVKRMLKDQVLVRNPVGIETSGCMDLLFTDKTGTLTEGKPVCTSLILGNGEIYDKKTDEKFEQILQLSVYYNTSCKMAGKRYIGGNGTETALCSFLNNDRLEAEVLEKMPFDSKNKYSKCTVRYKGENIVLIKGAAEILLPKCTEYLDGNGKRHSFDRQKTETEIKKEAQKGNRMIVLAYKENGGSDERYVFLCTAKLSDRPRKDAAEAVNTLEKAGIHTVMITGDGKDTAENIAKECGILKANHDLSVSGKELSEKTDLWIKENVDRLALVYRAMPNDKNRLVKAAKERGKVVGMTGDGINDAPALKNADVGFAMGSGTDVAKEAGDIIILDNRLSSIAQAVLYGRTIFKSIRKFITFQLIMNLCAVGVSFFGQLMGIDHPITVIQMLWINIIMDTLGGLAFAGEYPQKKYLKEPPLGREEPILTKKSYKQIVIMGCYGILLCTAFLSVGIKTDYIGYAENPLPLLTAFFALFIFTGILICFTARSERKNILAGLTKNKSFILIMSLITIIQMIMLYFGGNTFRCGGLSLKALGTVAFTAFTVVPADLIRRLIGERHNC